MDNATRLTNLEVTGDLEVGGSMKQAASKRVTTADAEAAVGEAPTAAEFKKVVDLVNALKTAWNGSCKSS